MSKVLLKTIDLDNGLKLNIFDASKKIAGDRWFVGMIAEIDIQLDSLSDVNNDELPVNLDKLKETVGDRVIYEKKMDRNFIDENEKEDVFNDMVDSFLSIAQKYLSNPKFPLKFVLKKYQESLKNMR